MYQFLLGWARNYLLKGSTKISDTTWRDQIPPVTGRNQNISYYLEGPDTTCYREEPEYQLLLGGTRYHLLQGGTRISATTWRD
jgi:hypothetical protein